MPKISMAEDDVLHVVKHGRFLFLPCAKVLWAILNKYLYQIYRAKKLISIKTSVDHD